MGPPRSRGGSRGRSRAQPRSRRAATASRSRSTTAASIIGIWPGFHDRAFGVAIDVGSTTIAGAPREPARWRCARVRRRDEPPDPLRRGPDEPRLVRDAPRGRGARDDALRSAPPWPSWSPASPRTASVAPREILEVTLVGNPIMHHLVLGIDPVPLGVGAVRARHGRRRADDGRGDRDPRPSGCPPVRAAVHRRPRRGRHGGRHPGRGATAPPRRASISSWTSARTPRSCSGIADRLLAASSPTGPAFEGAQISAGQRAAAGAIERVRIDRATLEPRFRVIGVDAWSDEPGFAESLAAAGTGVTGICGSGIVEVIAELFLAGGIAVRRHDRRRRCRALVADRHGRRGRSRTSSTSRRPGSPGQRIRITQNDVRAIQLAKAALYAGVRLLMDELGVEQVDTIRLAGAFGSQIDVFHAMVLGLIPDCDLRNVSSAGNAAGTSVPSSRCSRPTPGREIETVVRRVQKVETAVEPRFQEHFVDAMALPHRTAPSTNLSRCRRSARTVARRGSVPRSRPRRRRGTPPLRRRRSRRPPDDHRDSPSPRRRPGRAPSRSGRTPSRRTSRS